MLGAGDMLDVDALPEDGLDLEATLDTIESRYLQRALDRTGGVQTKAAELLKMTFRQFRYKLQKHHMVRRESGTDT